MILNFSVSSDSVFCCRVQESVSLTIPSGNYSAGDSYVCNFIISFEEEKSPGLRKTIKFCTSKWSPRLVIPKRYATFYVSASLEKVSA